MSDPVLATVAAVLAEQGASTSGQLQALLARSQPTVSRLLTDMAAQIVVLGSGRSTRYALPKAIMGAAAQQPLYWVDEDGAEQHWGQLSFLHGDQLHVQADGLDVLRRSLSPWFLAPLRTEGFLGRNIARRLSIHGLPHLPERWSLEQVLFAALHTPDGPGAIVLGEPMANPLPLLDHDSLAEDVNATGHWGSSAGGEQPKFLARRPSADGGQAVLVKFTPPRGTPFGERWHDLLHAEALALQLLGETGVAVAQTRIHETAKRTYLESTRFDRCGAHGRSHVVPLHAVHEAFVPGYFGNWASSCDVLVKQKRLPAQAGAQVRALMQFGRLIGNSDMHFGNLSLAVQREDIARGRFTLAPLYDMLPMRWRPNPGSGELDWYSFEPQPIDLQSAARPVALQFWQRVKDHPPLSAGMRALAAIMIKALAQGAR